MAFFTETLSEYVKNGGELPAVFGIVPAINIGNGNTRTFSDLFKERYFNREIGFETEELFLMKLDGKACEVCPIYANRISLIAGLNLIENEYTEETETTADASTDKLKNYDNPITNTDGDAPANALTGQNSNEYGEKHGVTTITKTGFSENKIIDFIKYMETDIKNLYVALLDEFDTLFMGVFK